VVFRPASAKDLQAKKAASRFVDIVLEPKLATEWEEAQQAKKSAEALVLASSEPVPQKLRARLAETEDAVDELRTQVEQNTVRFTVKSIGRKPYEELIAAHLPTQKQKQEWKKIGLTGDPPWNDDSFPQALLAKSAIDPAGAELMSEDQWIAIYDSPDWNAGELNSLFTAALLVNSETHIADLGKGFGQTTD
jgi:hypothetical protein